MQINKKLLVISAFIILVLGFGLGSSTQSVPKVEIKEVIKEVRINEDDWKKLKALDDQIINNAGTGYAICSKMITAVSTFNITELNKNTAEMSILTKEITNFGEKRKSILTRLGY